MYILWQRILLQLILRLRSRFCVANERTQSFAIVQFVKRTAKLKAGSSLKCSRNRDTLICECSQIRTSSSKTWDAFKLKVFQLLVSVHREADNWRAGKSLFIIITLGLNTPSFVHFGWTISCVENSILYSWTCGEGPRNSRQWINGGGKWVVALGRPQNRDGLLGNRRKRASAQVIYVVHWTVGRSWPHSQNHLGQIAVHLEGYIYHHFFSAGSHIRLSAWETRADEAFHTLPIWSRCFQLRWPQAFEERLKRSERSYERN